MQLFLSTTLIALIFSLITSVHAAGHLEIRAAASKCNANDCYRAAVRSSVRPGPASASADCASFMRVTATPCPTTTTITTLGASSTSTTTVGGNNEVGQAAILKRLVVANPTCTGPSSVTPTAVPSYASSACGPSASASARYSSACSCKGQTQSVTTVATPTSTQSIAVIATPALCGNQGVNYNYYEDDSFHNSFGSAGHYDQFDPQKYSSLTPNEMGTTNTIGPIHSSGSSETGTIYCKSVQSHDYVIDHQTYFVPPIDGLYIFSIKNIDDLALLYTGQNAIQGYSKTNYDLLAGFFNDAGKTVSKSYQLSQGEFFPVRLFYVNAPGAANLAFSVTGPTPFDQSNALDSFFVRSSCDTQTAAPF